MRTTSTPGKQAGFWHRLKNSTMQTPWHILRQLALLAPLGTLCLPMFYAGHKNVSLITIILCLSNHGADLRPMITDKGYGFAVATVFCALELVIAELICSLFTAAKGGDRRNMTAFGINAAVFALTDQPLSVLSSAHGFSSFPRIFSSALPVTSEARFCISSVTCA